MQAIADQFFQPLQLKDQYGNPIFHEAPAASVARKLLDQDREKLVSMTVKKSPSTSLRAR
jgi:hypothetical protein